MSPARLVQTPLASALALFACAGCSETRTALELTPATRAVVLDELGLALDVPPDWTVTTDGGASIISGPEGTASHLTPIVVQVLLAETEAPPPQEGPPAPAPRLADVLTRAYGRATLLSDVRWSDPGFAIVADRIAALYDVRFELFERSRRRVGALVDLSPYVVDLSYAAVDELFGAQLPVFAEALDSVSIEP